MSISPKITKVETTKQDNEQVLIIIIKKIIYFSVNI